MVFVSRVFRSAAVPIKTAGSGDEGDEAGEQQD
jgi:uncharacterized membrane protein YdbT with pleckstrin-like domain